MQSIERAFAVLGRAGRRAARRDRGGRAASSCPRAPSRGSSRRSQREGAVEQVPGRHPLPGRIADRDPGRRPSCRPGAWSPSPGRSSRPWPGRSARPPACPCPTASWSTTSTRSTRPTRSRSATGPARASRCTPSLRAWSCWPTVPPASLDALPRPPDGGFTPATVTDRPPCASACAGCQLDGYAWIARGVFGRGHHSVAAAVADEDGEVVAAVHVHGPSYRFPEPGAEARIGSEVVAAAARISARIRSGAASTTRRNGPAGADPGRL